MECCFESTHNTRTILEHSLKYIRSDVPTQVTEQERERLLENDVLTIIDLRTEEERFEKECSLIYDSRFQYHCLPVTGGDTIPSSVGAVSRSYIAMVDAKLSHTIDFLWNARSNVLYFCNAGKDRTGVVSAILLYKLGMPLDYIIADYMKSKTNLKEMLETFAGQHPDISIDVITPREDYIREFLEWFIRSENK